MDFKLFKKGEKRVLVNSSHSTFFGRSVNAELDLEAGEYVVHARIDRQAWRSKVCRRSLILCCGLRSCFKATVIILVP